MSGLIRRRTLLACLVTMAVLVSCSDPVSPPVDSSRRWYTLAQVDSGSLVFQQHCAECHGDAAQGRVSDWRQKLADGSFPPPPLNGTAHAWHHPRSVLLQVINNGGAELGGKMPGFAEVLDEQQKLAVIAFIQNLWTDETYSQWMQMGGTN